MIVIFNAKKLKLTVQIPNITIALGVLLIIKEFNRLFKTVKKIKKLFSYLPMHCDLKS